MNNNNLVSNYILPYKITAEWTSYFVFTLIFGPLVILGIYDSFISTSAWQMVLLLIIALSSFLIWLNSFSIIIKDDNITYKTLFTRTKDININNITQINITVGLGEESVKKSAFYRLNLYDREKYYNNPLSINMKPFSKRDLAFLVNTIVGQNPSVKSDKLTEQLLKGNIKPVVSLSIKKIWQVALYLLLISLSLTLIKTFL